MKRISYILILIVGISSVLSAQQRKASPRLSAQERYEQRLAEVQAYNAYVERYMSRDISHRLGGWAQLGYSAMRTGGFNTFQVSSKGGVGGGLGLGYQMRYKSLLLQTGAEFQLYNVALSLYGEDAKTPVLARTYPIEIASPSGAVSAQARYSYANTTERLLAGYIQIPLMAGMELIDHQMYFLVGPKVGFNVLADSKMKTDASISVIDQELIDPLHDIPTHNLVAQTLSQRQKAAFAMNVAISAEVGMSLDKYYQPAPDVRKSKLTDAQIRSKSLHTRLAVFGEYGLMNVNSNKSTSGWDIPFSSPKVGEKIDINNIEMCSSVETTGAADAYLNPWMVGVKVTLMYDLPRKELRTKPLPKAPQQPQPQTQPQPQPQPEPEPEVYTYEEQVITKGMKIKVDNLFFATNKTEVLPESGPALENLAEFLRTNPKVRIRLIGHTDSIGTDRDNQILSEGRVNSVRNEMIKRGIEASRMEVEGRGESQPVDTNSTEEGRQNNRRVEFEIISTGEED